jgi:hypothetical protein
MKYSLAVIAIMAATVFAKANPCKDETEKSEVFYEICSKFDRKSAGYTECIKIFMDQKAKSIETCNAPLAPAPVAAPAPAPVAAPAPAPVAAPAPVITPIVAPVAALAPPVLAASSSLSPGCISEFSGLATSDFDMLGFVKKLPPEIVKVKIQAKIPKTPFNKGPDPDDKKTSVGITVGCLKAFPETPKEIMPVLKDVSIEMSIGIVASKAGIARNAIPNDINQLRDLALQSGAKSVADALGFLAGGSGGAAEAAEAGDDESENGGGDKKGVKFGIRTGYNMYDFSFGHSDWDKRIGIDMGYGFGAGLVLNIPVASIMKLNMVADFYYRKLFNYMNEFALSIPVTLEFGKSFYLATGIQLDIPFGTDITGNKIDDYFEKKRSSMDFGLAAGLGYRFTHVGLDFKYVYSLTGIFEDFDYYKDKSSLMQYGLGLSYFF